ncbi:peptidase M20 domain-containing protein 2-like [Ixodes scapularis]|uniref:peptidase M20 domain-containing protein 2-like n=2 Tax=Ixodes scapularis TaxID=6945 RepID=UPI001A9EED45|nr:peptidase M20 domain-containing protein 2-like [Ixodes scapularis]
MSSGAAMDSFEALVEKAVDSRRVELHALSDYLWRNPELALKEFKAHERLTEFLENQGFRVQRHWLLDTAFRAEFDNTRGAEGPTVAFMCEFDALPEIGHGCGHNLIAECSVAAGIAVMEALKARPDIPAKVLVLGTPAEENCGGKEMLLQKGAFRDVDVALMAHPGRRDALKMGFTASQHLSVKFRGRTAHAAASPWEGLNALDAAVTSYMNISVLRQQMKPAWRVHGVMLQAGKYPNLIPEESELKYHIRAPSTEELDVILSKVEACFRGAAEATGCSVDIIRGMKYKHMLHNDTIVSVYQRHGEALGITFEGEDPRAVIGTGASTDAANVSHAVPTAHPVYALRATARNHTREFSRAAGDRDAQEPTLKVARALALTALDFLKDSELLRKAKEEFAFNATPSS